MCCRKQRVQDGVDALQDELLTLSHFIHTHPEIGLKEFQAVKKITGFLKANRCISSRPTVMTYMWGKIIIRMMS